MMRIFEVFALSVIFSSVKSQNKEGVIYAAAEATGCVL